MSFIELLIILLITIGITDKKKIQKIYNRVKIFQNGPTRGVVGDQSLQEKWIWIDSANSEEE